MRWPSRREATVLIFALPIVPITFGYTYSTLLVNCAASLDAVMRSLDVWLLLGIPLGFLLSLLMVILAFVRRESRGHFIRVFLAYIGILFLGLVFVASLSTARSKGRDAVIMESLSSIRAVLSGHERFPLTPTQSCTEANTVFDEPTVQEIIERLSKREPGSTPTCISNGYAWAVAAPLPSGSGPHYGLLCKPKKTSTPIQFCVDSSGAARTVKGSFENASCPAAYTPPRTNSGGIIEVKELDCIPRDVWDLMVKSGMRGSAVPECPE